MTKQIKDKTLSELTLEDKALIVTARDIYWIKEDLQNDDYMFISSIIMGEGYTQFNSEMYNDIITSEFDAIVDSDPNIEETKTVSDVLESVYDYAESIMDILNKISPKDE